MSHLNFGFIMSYELSTMN